MQALRSCKCGKNTYAEINNKAPFALSIGISRSQTGSCENTNTPEFINKTLPEVMLKQKVEEERVDDLVEEYDMWYLQK